MKQNFIPKECVKCSAPLTQTDHELICEYCETRYELPEHYEKETTQKASQAYRVEDTPNQYLDINQDLTTPRKRQIINTRIIFIVILVVFVLGFVVLRNISNYSRDSLTDNPETQFENQVYKKYFSSDEYPADFYHGSTLPAGVVFRRINDFPDEYLKFELFVQNNTERIITGDSKSNNLLIDDVILTDNFGTANHCELSEPFSKRDQLDLGEIGRVGYIYCYRDLKPEVKYLDMDIHFVNWGDYHFQIPIVPNIDKLNIDYSILRYNGKTFSLNIDFQSDQPQIISLYYDSISVIDEDGNVFQYDDCLPHSVTLEMRDTYARIVTNSNFLIQCSYDTPFPSESDSVTVIMTISGETIATTGVVNTIEGPIIFSRFPSDEADK